MELGDDLQTRNVIKELRPRLVLLMWLVAAGGVILLTRLYTLQIIRGEELSSRGRRNFVQTVRIPHDRGIIFDRYGRILVDNRPSLNLQITPAFLGKRPEARRILQHVGMLLALSPEAFEEMAQSVESRIGLDRFKPVLVRRDLDPTQVEAIEAERSVSLLDGVEIVEARRRVYHYGTAVAHLLGYVNEIDAVALDAERSRKNPDGYELGDLIGRDGVERQFEKELRGVDGADKFVVDAKGRRAEGAFVEGLLGEDKRVEPQPGHNVFLTIDIDLQRRAEQAFLEHGIAGSVVALDPTNGAVLAFASIPEYDPNRLSSGVVDRQAKESEINLSPWLNRPIQGQYVPGSTFKIATALAALREHVTTPQEKVFCPGSFRLGKYVWRCHKDKGHGYVDLHDAFKYSCDTYFYTMASRLGLNPIADAARMLGLGRLTGIPLRGEKSGLIPDQRYHEEKDGGYQKGMAVNASIGQGAVLVTPLQMAVAYGAIADGSKAFVPQLIDRVESADFRVIKKFMPMGEDQVYEQVTGAPPATLSGFTPQTLHELSFAAADIQSVRTGLFAVTSEPGGTGYGNRSKIVSMAGKTGTAQVVRLGRERLQIHSVEYEERDHAWFVAYAPFETPEIVISVLNEHSGHGGSQAAPVAVAVIDAFFELKQLRQARAQLLPK